MQGIAIKAIAAALSMAQNTVRRAIQAAQAGGVKASAKPTGCAVGQQQCLNDEQDLHIQRRICKNRPEQWKLTFALWTCAAVLLWVQIEVFYLGSYSPDLNPDERCNADLKHTLGSRVQTRSKGKRKEATQVHMELLKHNPERVRSYVQDPSVTYAAGGKA